jgi:ABC-type phosphate transport system ATPase subunit
MNDTTLVFSVSELDFYYAEAIALKQANMDIQARGHRTDRTSGCGNQTFCAARTG